MGLPCTALAGEEVLIFRNGDRLTVEVLSKTDTTLRVKSPVLGELEVKKADLVPAPAAQVADSTASPTAASTAGASVRPAESSPPPWRYGLNVSAEWKREAQVRRNVLVELTGARKWLHDELRLKTSYENTREAGATNTDLQKASIYYSHDVFGPWFVLYTADQEYNARGNVSGFPIHYLFVRQGIGVGRTVFKQDNFELKTGLAENFYFIWVWVNGHRAHGRVHQESAFLEGRWALPWRLELVEKGSFFFSADGTGEGYENILELTRRIDLRWRLSLRHELRENFPSVNVSDLNLWRIVLGVDL